MHVSQQYHCHTTPYDASVPSANEVARLPSAVVFDVIMLESAFDWL
jgi:hypothetical protein